ncbi:AlpA family transcriptional regulator [Pedobacter sp. V48]|uniref:helix-turn-helix transcriptional regulator n=1 Tax=Pedobacter sp. V48 TaxID=509635 RepID=UPI0003E4D95D|nr:helix-turn-helix domain-containing protein [Pedobacter sp. V48]ETZ22191.1 hypothetical protein N824_25015 [Pedobacter sp. V48]
MKIRVDKKCLQCGKAYLAFTIATRYCSKNCRSAFYKEQVRNLKIATSNHETLRQRIEYKMSLYETPFLKVGDVSFLLGCSKSNVYAMISTKKLRSVNLSERMIRLFREDIFFILEEHIKRDYYVVNKSRAGRENGLTENGYRIRELTSVFKKSKEALYAYLRRHKVPKSKVGREVLFSKDHIDKLYLNFIGRRYVGLEREREANLKLAKQKFGIRQCYSIEKCVAILGKPKELLYGVFNRRNVPKIKKGKKIFALKIVIDEMYGLIKKEGFVRKVTLRKKAISKGRSTLFLDIYPPVPHPETGAPIRKYYLKMYVFDKPHTEVERRSNKETLMLGELIRAQKQIEILQLQFSFLAGN